MAPEAVLLATTAASDPHMLAASNDLTHLHAISLIIKGKYTNSSHHSREAV
jgi:hypothetical protein